MPPPVVPSLQSLPLTPEELITRLSINAVGVVSSVCDLARGQVEAEEKRDAALTAKASALLAASGLSVTVAFGFAGIVLKNPEYLGGTGDCATFLGFLGLSVFAGALVLGVVSGWYALSGLKIRGQYVGINEAALFNDTILSNCQNTWRATYAAAAADHEAQAEAASRAEYQRYLAVHFWSVWKKNFHLHEDKAKTILRGQKFYFGFLVCLMVLGLVMVVASYRRVSALNDLKKKESVVSSEPKPIPTPPPPTKTPPPPPAPTPTPPPGEPKHIQAPPTKTQ